MSKKDDGYIRIRCQECGKKLKAKKEYAGRVFTCNGCKSINVLPLADSEVADDGAADPVEGIGKDGTPIRAVGQTGWRPGVKDAQNRIRELDALVSSVTKCHTDTFERAQNVLGDSTLSEEQQEKELLEVRRDHDVEIRRLVVQTRDSIKKRVADLQSHPMAKSVAIQQELQEALRHLSAFRLLAKCLFG